MYATKLGMGVSSDMPSALTKTDPNLGLGGMGHADES